MPFDQDQMAHVPTVYLKLDLHEIERESSDSIKIELPRIWDWAEIRSFLHQELWVLV